MTREVFVAGQILTAAEMNVVSDQTVMSFAGTAARGSAIPSPVEGMTTYLEDSNSVQIYDGSAWKRVLNTTGSILQVVSTTKTDTFGTTSTSFVSVTGLSASITPVSTTSNVLVMVSLTGLHNFSTQANYFRLMRGATAIAIGNAAGNRERATFQVGNLGADHVASGVMNHLDSPATTSSVTYSVEMRVSGATGYVNRGINDVDNINYARTASSITLIEVAG